MTSPDRYRTEHENHSAHDGHTGMGRGGHHWMMIACCIPMIIIAVALVATGVVGTGFILVAFACLAMMWLMMRAMDGMGHGSGPAGPDR